MFDQELIDRIADAVAQRLAIKPQFEPLWSAEEVAEYLKVSRRQVVERLAKRQGFPTPIVMPTDTGEAGRLRWDREKIIAWACQKDRRAA